jgi:hypothetical protein
MNERLSARVGFSRQTLDETMKAQEKVRFIVVPPPTVVPRRNPATDERIVRSFIQRRVHEHQHPRLVRSAFAGYEFFYFFATALFSPFMTRG